MKPLIWEVGEDYFCVLFPNIATVTLLLHLFQLSPNVSDTVAYSQLVLTVTRVLKCGKC